LEGVDRGLASNNHIEPGGHPVRETGRTLRGRAMTLLLVRATDLDETTQLARGCPIFDFE